MPATYAYSWAIGVIKELNGKYARAASSVYTMLGISPSNHAYYLANRSRMFVRIKELVKFNDQLFLYLGAGETTIQMYSAIMDRWTEKERETMYKLLDRKKNRFRLELRA